MCLLLDGAPVVRLLPRLNLSLSLPPISAPRPLRTLTQRVTSSGEMLHLLRNKQVVRLGLLGDASASIHLDTHGTLASGTPEDLTIDLVFDEGER